jgi:hypothetical protein
MYSIRSYCWKCGEFLCINLAVCLCEKCYQKWVSPK